MLYKPFHEKLKEFLDSNHKSKDLAKDLALHFIPSGYLAKLEPNDNNYLEDFLNYVIFVMSNEYDELPKDKDGRFWRSGDGALADDGQVVYVTAHRGMSIVMCVQHMVPGRPCEMYPVGRLSRVKNPVTIIKEMEQCDNPLVREYAEELKLSEEYGFLYREDERKHNES